MTTVCPIAIIDHNEDCLSTLVILPVVAKVDVTKDKVIHIAQTRKKTARLFKYILNLATLGSATAPFFGPKNNSIKSIFCSYYFILILKKPPFIKRGVNNYLIYGLQSKLGLSLASISGLLILAAVTNVAPVSVKAGSALPFMASNAPFTPMLPIPQGS